MCGLAGLATVFCAALAFVFAVGFCALFPYVNAVLEPRR